MDLTPLQAVNNAVTYGFGIMAGFLLNGWFFEILGALLLFAASALIAGTGGVLMAFSNRLNLYDIPSH